MYRIPKCFIQVNTALNELEINKPYSVAELRDKLKSVYGKEIENKELSKAQAFLFKHLKNTEGFKYIRTH